MTTLSQPFDAINVMDADVSLEVYVLPSIHVKLPQAVIISELVIELVIVKFNVTILSQPFDDVKVIDADVSLEV